MSADFYQKRHMMYLHYFDWSKETPNFEHTDMSVWNLLHYMLKEASKTDMRDEDGVVKDLKGIKLPSETYLHFCTR